jgi:hypothetical protein
MFVALLGTPGAAGRHEVPRLRAEPPDARPGTPFLQDASHELRTPITIALGHAELIQRNQTDPTMSEDIRVVVEGCSGSTPGRPSAHARLARTARLRLTPLDLVPCGRPRPPLVPAPRHWMLGQLGEPSRRTPTGSNWRSTSSRTPSSTPSPTTISFSLRRQGDRITISIADTGAASPARTWDASSSASRATGSYPESRQVGSGLGLSIAALIEPHGGSISVKRARPGSTFLISLPIDDRASVAAAPPRRLDRAPAHESA